MSNDEPVGSQITNNDSDTTSIRTFDMDWCMPSPDESANINPPPESNHSPSTAFSTRANTRRDAETEGEEAPVMPMPEVPEIPFVRSPSPILAPPTIVDSPHPSRRGSQNNAEPIRNSDLQDPPGQRNDTESRRNSTLRREADLPPLPTTGRVQSQRQRGIPFPGSPLNPANNNDECRPLPSRSSSSRMPPVQGPGPSPYPGLYITPQMCAPPLSYSPYVQPIPVDFYPRPAPIPAYPVPGPMPTPFMPLQGAPPCSPFVQPGTPIPPQNPRRQSGPDSIVTAVAMAPELKNLAPLVEPRPVRDTELFADNDPYTIRSHSRRERVSSEIRNPYPPTPPPPTSQPIYAGSRYGSYPIDLPPMVQPPSQTMWPPPSVLQPVIPERTPTASPAWYRKRRLKYSRPDRPLESYYPLPRMTTAEVVSATANMPTPENRRDSMDSESVRIASPFRYMASPITATRPLGTFAANDPYRLPRRRLSMENLPTAHMIETPPTTHIPPIMPNDMRRPTSPRPGQWSSSSDYVPDDHSQCNSLSSRQSQGGNGSSSNSMIYPLHRRSSSLDRSQYRRNRRGWLRHSPPIEAPPIVPLPGPSFIYSPSAPGMIPLRGRPLHMGFYSMRKRPYFGAPMRRGFWSRVSTFFKSPFDKGRPISLYNPSLESDEPVTWFFILKVIFSQIYFHMLLRIPSLYFSRVSWIFDEANLSLYELTEMALETSGGSDSKEKAQPSASAQTPDTPKVRPQYERLKNSWEAFIDSLIHEWETFNIVSVMLLTAILTLLQIGTNVTDPVTRYAALFSLLCGLVSLLLGCLYIIRFGTMRKTYAAVEWAKTALSSSHSILWNVWVLLSIPAIWLTWSILLFVVSIMSFVWRTNPASAAVSTFILSSTGLLIVRIGMSAVLGLGVIDAMLVMNTFRLYGEALDKDWRKCIILWQQAKAIEAPAMNLLTANNTPSDRFLAYLQPFLQFGPPMIQAPVPVPVAIPPPLPAMFPMAPPVILPYPDFGESLREHRRKRRLYSNNDSDSDSTSSASSSTSVHPRRRVRHRSRSPVRLSRSIHVPSRSLPTRSSMRSPRARDQPQHPIVSPIPRRPVRINLRANVNAEESADAISDTNARRGPSLCQGSDYPEEYGQQESRVRFRSPLASAQESSDWGIYDSSFDGSSNRILRPSSSSTSGVAPESTNVHIQNSEALRRRRV
ncbi:hypothetical protein BDN70DRAFT_878977 [Pholiota conissans]|uniref:Transmembrane protein n=1 Tax=Pholiota conissans TaxID=109636 RepID=A0A9P5Z3P2_9AGAR|nr:hypothetical protein BDN70DRAFT_878977 [Pholiota conissans]